MLAGLALGALRRAVGWLELACNACRARSASGAREAHIARALGQIIAHRVGGCERRTAETLAVVGARV